MSVKENFTTNLLSDVGVPFLADDKHLMRQHSDIEPDVIKIPKYVNSKYYL